MGYKSKTGGGVGSNQYQSRGAPVSRTGPTAQDAPSLLDQLDTPKPTRAEPAPSRSAPPQFLYHIKTSRADNSPSRKGRIYMNIGGDRTVQEPNGPMCTKPGCRCGGNTVDHTVWKGYLRKAIAERRAIVGAAGLDNKDISWSSKAGCSSCPCSPGFVSNAPEHHGKDIWVSALVGEPGPQDGHVVASLPDLDAETLTRMCEKERRPAFLQAISRHPNFPPHLRSMVEVGT